MADNVTIDTLTGSPVAKTIDTGTAHLQQVVVGDIVRIEDSFSRVADTTAYSAGDLVASTTTAASVTAANSAFVLASVTRDADLGAALTHIILRKTKDDTAAANFRVHLFDTDPFASTPTNGDNGDLDLAAGAGDDYLGYVDVTCDLQIVNSENFGVGFPTIPILVKAASGTTIWGVLEARGAYTPESAETFTLYAFFKQD